MNIQINQFIQKKYKSAYRVQNSTNLEDWVMQAADSHAAYCQVSWNWSSLSNYFILTLFFINSCYNE